MEEQSTYGLVVRFELLGGHEEAFDALTAETLAAIRTAEAGTLVYLTHTEPTIPRTRVFYELYRTEADFDAHEAAPYVRRFLADRGQHLARDPEVWRVTTLGGLVRSNADLGGG